MNVFYIQQMRALSGAFATAITPNLSLDFSVTYSFRPYHGPAVDSASSENEYQEHFLEVKVAGA